MKRSVFHPAAELPAELAAEADRVVADLLGSLNRARDHVLDPARHKLSSDPLEKKLATGLKKLKSRLGKAKLKAPPTPAAARRPLPKSAPLTEAQVRAELEKLFAGDMSALATGVPRAIVSRALNINTLACVQDTIEPGKDEIVMGTVATTLRVLADGTISTAVTTREVDLGQFRQDDSAVFNPPRALASFDNVETPAILSVHLVLAETDLAGGLGAVLRDLVDGVENRFNGKKFTALFSGAAGLVSLWPLIAAMFEVTLGSIVALIVIVGIIMVIAAVVAALLVAIFKLFRDEIFPTQSLAINLDAAGALIGGTAGPIPMRFSRQVAVYDAEVEWS